MDIITVLSHALVLTNRNNLRDWSAFQYDQACRHVINTGRCSLKYMTPLYARLNIPQAVLHQPRPEDYAFRGAVTVEEYDTLGVSVGCICQMYTCTSAVKSYRLSMPGLCCVWTTTLLSCIHRTYI